MAMNQAVTDIYARFGNYEAHTYSYPLQSSKQILEATKASNCQPPSQHSEWMLGHWLHQKSDSLHVPSRPEPTAEL